MMVMVSSILFGQIPEGYYDAAIGKTGGELKNALHDIIKKQTVFSYGSLWNQLSYTDADPNNSNNVICLYSGWSYPASNHGGSSTQWNREHTWAKSVGNFGTANGPGTDLHHLRPTDVTVNSKRGNLQFDNGGSEYVDKSRYGGGNGNTGCKVDGDSWEPRDEVKGDVARMLFYMATRYEGDGDGSSVDLELGENQSGSGTHAKLSTLLAWHKADPVSDWERRRNNRIYERQKNRNPFIDHPEWVSSVFGDGGGEDPGPGNSELVLFSEKFDGGTGLNNMTQYSVTGNQVWKRSTYQNNSFAKMSGYDYSKKKTFANEDWLINKEVITIGDAKDVAFSFTTSMKEYGGNTEFNVLISTDYDGKSNPNNYSWTNITSNFDFSSGNYELKESGEYKLGNQINKPFYIAFKHVNTAKGSRTWQVDNILVKGAKATSINFYTLSGNVYLVPNPAKDYVVVSGKNYETCNVSIYNLCGYMISKYSSYKFGEQINLSDFQKGIYLIKISMKNNKIVTKKLIIN